MILPAAIAALNVSAIHGCTKKLLLLHTAAVFTVLFKQITTETHSQSRKPLIHKQV